MIPPSAQHKDYYAVMGLQSDASAHDIKMAYRRLARKYHPDLNKEADAEKNFKDLGEAYEVLRDPEKRKLYDQMCAQPQSQPGHQYTGEQDHAHGWPDWGQEASPGGGFDADWFETLFGAQRQRGGADLHGKITISLQEAYSGVDKEITFPASNKTSEVQKLRVKIPAGVKSEQKIRLAGIGEPGHQGAPSGDLYLTIVVKRDPIFDLVGNDVYLTLPVAPWEVALGATITVPTLHGKVALKIPPHSQGGQTFRLKQKGFPAANPGDQFVLLKIMIPQPTTPAANALYQKMAQDLPFNPRKHLEDYHG
jgi:curved DNA-binding protein